MTMCLQRVKICYRSLIFMKFSQHILNIYGQFLCWNGIFDRIVLKFEFQIWMNTKIIVDNWGTMA